MWNKWQVFISNLNVIQASDVFWHHFKLQGCFVLRCFLVPLSSHRYYSILYYIIIILYYIIIYYYWFLTRNLTAIILRNRVHQTSCSEVGKLMLYPMLWDLSEIGSIDSVRQSKTFVFSKIKQKVRFVWRQLGQLQATVFEKFSMISAHTHVFIKDWMFPTRSTDLHSRPYLGQSSSSWQQSTFFSPFFFSSTFLCCSGNFSESM